MNHIRGMNPFPTAWILVDGKKLKVHRSRVFEGNQTGAVADADPDSDDKSVGRIVGGQWIEVTEALRNLIEVDQNRSQHRFLWNELKDLMNLDGKLVAKCVDGMVEFTEVQLEGKRVTSGEEFLRGYQGDLAIS